MAFHISALQGVTEAIGVLSMVKNEQKRVQFLWFILGLLHGRALTSSELWWSPLRLAVGAKQFVQFNSVLSKIFGVHFNVTKRLVAISTQSRLELRAVRRYRSIDFVEHRRLHSQLDAVDADDPGRTVEATGPHFPCRSPSSSSSWWPVWATWPHCTRIWAHWPSLSSS